MIKECLLSASELQALVESRKDLPLAMRYDVEEFLMWLSELQRFGGLDALLAIRSITREQVAIHVDYLNSIIARLIGKQALADAIPPTSVHCLNRIDIVHLNGLEYCSGDWTDACDILRVHEITQDCKTHEACIQKMKTDAVSWYEVCTWLNNRCHAIIGKPMFRGVPTGK